MEAEAYPGYSEMKNVEFPTLLCVVHLMKSRLLVIRTGPCHRAGSMSGTHLLLTVNHPKIFL